MGTPSPRPRQLLTSKAGLGQRLLCHHLWQATPSSGFRMGTLQRYLDLQRTQTNGPYPNIVGTWSSILGTLRVRVTQNDVLQMWAWVCWLVVGEVDRFIACIKLTWEDPKSRSPNSELNRSYGVDYRSLRWIYFLDPPRGLGMANGRYEGAADPLWSVDPSTGTLHEVSRILPDCYSARALLFTPWLQQVQKQDSAPRNWFLGPTSTMAAPFGEYFGTPLSDSMWITHEPWS